MRRASGLLLLFAFGLLVFFITREAYRPDEPTDRVNATVLLERVRPVLKLVTVEGDFSELYDHTDQWKWWYGISGLTEKRAILRVRATVHVGYDLEGLQISVDEQTRTMTLDAPPHPKVLSIDHDLDFYDIKEGYFNHFSPKELTTLSANAKTQVLKKVAQTQLFVEAVKQRDAVVEVVRSLVESAGWTLELGWEPKDGRTRLKVEAQ